MSLSLVPRPRSVVPHSGAFPLTPDTPLAAPPQLAGVAAWLRGVLGPATGCPLLPGTGGITLTVDRTLPAEAYRLEVTTERVVLAGGDPAGVGYAAQTLRQLLPPAVLRRAPVAARSWSVPAVTIRDEPRYRWRGCLLDVARHFVPKADLLRFVDLLALHKLNVLHLHLTDDQGWRLEIPGYPRLAEVGAWRPESMVGAKPYSRSDGRPHGGYYSRDDIREIVGYAAERFITVVPEVDLPGHSQAAIAAYPHLGTARVGVRTAWGISPHLLTVTDEALAFCRDILDAVCGLFPGRHVGIGGDECATDAWRTDPAAQQRIGSLGLSGVDALQGWFVDQLAAHLRGAGRQPFAWDDVLGTGAPPGMTIAAWHPGMVAAAARAGYDVVACPHTATYLDYRQSDRPDEPVPVGTVLTTADVYRFDPAALAPEHPRRVLGGQCNVWTEHLPSARALDYAAFPRLCAFAEAVWTGGERDPDGFARRLTGHLARLDALGVEYRPATGPHPWQTGPRAAADDVDRPLGSSDQ